MTDISNELAAVSAEWADITAGRPVQLTQGDLKGMSPAAIVAAQSEGRCDRLLGVPPKPRADYGNGQLTAAELKTMSPAAVVAAHAAGRCQDLLNPTTTNRTHP